MAEKKMVLTALLAIATAVLLFVLFQPSAPRAPAANFSMSGCSQDRDCVLVDSDLFPTCCWSGACEPVDYSLEKWISVNLSWFSSMRDRLCPSVEKCGGAPNCDPKPTNDGFKARCVSGSCEKAPIIGSYVACGCGCCPDVLPLQECIYHSELDSIERIIERDRLAAASEQCPTTGCSRGMNYTFCD